MENIPSSFIGYNKTIVNDILNQKDTILNTQQNDINYLRNEISRLEKNIENNKNISSKNSKKSQ